MKRHNLALVTGAILLSILTCNLPTPTPAEQPTEPPETTTSESPPTLTHTPTLPPSPTPNKVAATPLAPVPPPQVPTAPTNLNVPLRIDNPTDTTRTGEPITSGVPLPRDLGITDPTQLRLVDAEGNPIPAQFTPLARWGGAPDDDTAPIRWVLLDFQVVGRPQQTAYYFLQEGGPGPAPAHPLTITDEPGQITIDTGVASFSINKSDGGLTAPSLSAPIHGRIYGLDGAVHTTFGPVAVNVVLQGPMRASIHVQGSYGENSGLDYTSRYWFYAGQSSVRLFHTVENNTPCPLIEYGQLDCHDIGSGGSVTFGDLSLIIPTVLGTDLTCVVGGESGPADQDLNADLVLLQDSSGTDHWDTYPTLTDWDGNPLDTQPRLQSYVTFRGYRANLGESTVDSGNHAPGWLSVTGENGSWAVGVRDFWQNFPKALRAQPDGILEIGLFPEEFGPPDHTFTLRAGEHKTHEIILSPGHDKQSNVTLSPLHATAPPQWYVDSGAFGLTALPNQTDWPDHENYISHQLDTAPAYEDWMDWYPSLPAAIAATDFYGIFDYGDWPLDYEGYRVAPMNVKYDADYGAWLQWARTGDPRWFHVAEAADRHIADIDILHNLHTPRHWGDGIAFGHSYHDEDGFLNPHRNYGGTHPDTAFGMHGLLLTYYLTGYEKAYDSALELADCIEYRLHNDYHLCYHFSECSGEGYGLGDSDGLYGAGARPAANGLSIAVAAYRATADLRYLAVSNALVDWARAENQPYINGPTGEDQQMRPWMLNMYLRALAGYLEMQDEFDLPDNSDARDSYLAYADWLRAHAWIDLEPIETGPRAAYPYEWWFDARQGDPNNEWSAGNNIPSINNWLLLGADAMAYAHRISGDPAYLEHAAALFRTGSRDPWFEDDENTYNSTKETANSVAFGHTFLHQWAQRE